MRDRLRRMGEMEINLWDRVAVCVLFLSIGVAGVGFEWWGLTAGTDDWPVGAQAAWSAERDI